MSDDDLNWAKWIKIAESEGITVTEVELQLAKRKWDRSIMGTVPRQEWLHLRDIIIDKIEKKHTANTSCSEEKK